MQSHIPLPFPGGHGDGTESSNPLVTGWLPWQQAPTFGVSKNHFININYGAIQNGLLCISRHPYCYYPRVLGALCQKTGNKNHIYFLSYTWFVCFEFEAPARNPSREVKWVVECIALEMAKIGLDGGY